MFMPVYKPPSTDFLLPIWKRLGISRESWERLERFKEQVETEREHLRSTAHKIEYLTGYTLDDILKKVAAGYRLEFHKPPNIEFSETAKLVDFVIGEGE